MQVLFFLLAITVGFTAGIAINALADSLPRSRTSRKPFYPPNGPDRPTIAWSGTIAFLTGHRTSPPLEDGDTLKLPWRHPIVEIAMALIFGFLVVNWPNHQRLLVWMIYLAILMLVTIIDIEHYLILFPVIIPGCLIAIAVAIIFPAEDRRTIDYVIGGLMGGGIFLLMFWGGGIFSGLVSAARGEELEEIAFGFGDVMLATLCGLMIGWQAFIFAMVITVFSGAAGAIIYIIVRMLVSREYDFFTPLPYGPYIVLGTVVMMLWRDDVRQFLIGS